MTLKNIVEIINPVAIKKSDHKTDFKLILPSCVKDGKLISYEYGILAKDVNNRYKLKKNDILFQIKGNKFESILIEKDEKDLFPSQSYFILRVATKMILPKYLQWILRTEEATKYFNQHTSGSIISIIRKSNLEEFEFTLPPLEEQDKFVKLINSYEIEKLETEKYLEIKKRLIEKKILEKYEVK